MRPSASVLRSTADLVVRTALPTDDLSLVYPNGEWQIPWNLDRVFCAVQDHIVLAACVVWDGGHPVVYVAHLSVVAEMRQHGIATRLMHGVIAWARAQGKTGLIATANIPYLLKLYQEYGAHITTPDYALVTWGILPCQD